MTSIKDFCNSLAKVPFIMHADFVRAQEYALAIWLSGKMSLNNGLKWSLTAIGILWWASTVHTLTSALVTFSWMGSAVALKKLVTLDWLSSALILALCYTDSRWHLTSFSPWCSQEIWQSQTVHLNLNETTDGWIKGQVLLPAGLNLVGYFAAPSSFCILCVTITHINCFY